MDLYPKNNSRLFVLTSILISACVALALNLVAVSGFPKAQVLLGPLTTVEINTTAPGNAEVIRNIVLTIPTPLGDILYSGGAGTGVYAGYIDREETYNLVVEGNFSVSSRVYINSSPVQTEVFQADILNAEIPGSMLSLGPKEVTVVSDSGTTNGIGFRIMSNPYPITTRIEPMFRPVGEPFTLTIFGDDFVPGTTVMVGERLVNSTFLNCGEEELRRIPCIHAVIPYQISRNAGGYNVNVYNPEPGGGRAARTEVLVIQPVPSPVPSPTPSPIPSPVPLPVPS